MKAIYWVIAVAVVSVTVFIYLVLGDSQKTVPKIKVSYFTNETEIASSITKILSQELVKTSHFWVGIEPEKLEQLNVVVSLKQELAKLKPLQRVIVDEELKLPKNWLEQLQATDSINFKENIQSTGELLKSLEEKNSGYFFVTANIYSNPFIKENPLNKIKKEYQIHPTTFSMAYFPIAADDEKNMLFPCNAEDHSGTSAWACMVSNKARFSRRKIDLKNEKPWISLMDLIGEKDYMILLKKR
ncbi:MAG: hypothetical protein H7061_02370 [Bdellovibrionaceae bacterium]|nr:hypothetical protein [Bdellovibrio sp.]